MAKCMFLKQDVTQAHFYPKPTKKKKSGSPVVVSSAAAKSRGFGVFSDVNTMLSYFMDKLRTSKETDKRRGSFEKAIEDIKRTFPGIQPASITGWVTNASNPLRVANVEGWCDPAPGDTIQPPIRETPGERVAERIVVIRNGQRKVYFNQSLSTVFGTERFSSQHIMPARVHANRLYLYPQLVCDPQYCSLTSATVEFPLVTPSNSGTSAGLAPGPLAFPTTRTGGSS